jgi:hypothetical protein
VFWLVLVTLVTLGILVGAPTTIVQAEIRMWQGVQALVRGIVPGS